MNYDFEVIHKPGTDPMITVSDALSRTPITKNELESIGTSDIPNKIFHIQHLPGTEQTKTFLNNLYVREIAEHVNVNVLTRAQQKRTLSENATEQKATESVDKSPTVTYSDKNEPSDTKVLFEFGNLKVDRNELIRLQKADKQLEDVRQKLFRKSKTVCKKFYIDNDCLMNKSKTSKRYVLPRELAKVYLQYLHLFLGHLSQNKMIRQANRHVFIQNVHTLANDIVKSCCDCIRSKPAPKSLPIPAPPRHFSVKPFEKTHWDLWDAGSADSRGKRYLLGVTDELTSYTDGIPLPSKNEKVVAEAMLTLIFRYGIFNGTIVTDNGREWSSIWDRVCESLKLHHIRSSPYFSGSNGKIERKFRDLNTILRTHNIPISNWSSNIKYIMFLINNTPKAALGSLTPSEALFGRSLELPFETDQVESNAPFVPALNNYLRSLHPKLMELHYFRHKNSLRNRKNGVSLNIGDKCFAYKPCIENGKLSNQYQGPLEVVRRVGANTYELRDLLNKRILRRNIRHLRRIKSDDLLNFQVE